MFASPREQAEGGKKNKSEKAQENCAHGTARKSMDRRKDSGAGQKRAKNREAKRDDDQGQVPDLQHAPVLLNLNRVKKGSGWKPRHERRVFHRIPRPIPAPPQDVVRPPRTDQIAHRQKKPGDDSPPARGDDPGLVKASRN